MSNYNPRQNTRMRWKDARGLEKFKFITGDYDFDNEVLENASTDPLYKPLIDIMIESCNNNHEIKPLGILVDDSTAAQLLYTGNVVGYNIYMYALGSNNNIHNITIKYNPDTDTLTINYTVETFLAEDNVKTLFGQNITGTGDIKLYRHELIISTGRTSNNETEYKVYLTYYSSNNLVADTPEKLKTLTKANTTTILRGIVLEFANAEVQNATVSGQYSGVNYLGDQSGWALEKTIGGSDGTAITIVIDEVTPIF